MLRVGVVGHCSFADRDGEAFATDQCGALLRAALAGSESVLALSALAEGADTLFAEQAVDIGIPVHVVRPFAAHEDDFASPGAHARYLNLLALAERAVQMPYRRRSGFAYRAAMRWVAGHSDLLIAVWDGRRAARPGSTAETVAYARRLGRRVVHVDPLARTVRRDGDS